MRKAWMLGLVCVWVIAGCTQRSSPLIANDKAIRRPSVEMAAEAVKRFPYKADAPRDGEAQARAQVGYSLNVIEIVNLSDQDWQDVEIWVNRSWVIPLPVMERNKLKRIPFSAIFNDSGKTFPTNNKMEKVQLVELYRAGKMQDVRVQLAD